MHEHSDEVKLFFHTQSRLLLLVDELQRIGFEQLRFARSFAQQHVRIQVYPARHVLGYDWLYSGPASHFLLSGTQVITMFGQESALHEKWQRLLQGELSTKHLAGQFVLDFPEIMRPAYGPDHAYREWFRILRSHVQKGRLPTTYDEDNLIYGTGPDYTQYIEMQSPVERTILMPAPPLNPYWTPQAP